MTSVETTENQTPATRVVLSYSSTLSEHAIRRVQQDYYRTYLGKVHDTAAVGDIWAEFTDIGCCGSQESLTPRVEDVEGGSTVTPDTTFEFVERDVGACEVDWSLQHE